MRVDCAAVTIAWRDVVAERNVASVYYDRRGGAYNLKSGRASRGPHSVEFWTSTGRHAAGHVRGCGAASSKADACVRRTADHGARGCDWRQANAK